VGIVPDDASPPGQFAVDFQGDKSSGSLSQNEAASFRPGFQPSLAAQPTSERSSARVIVRNWAD
jgi:hypothetical protein